MTPSSHESYDVSIMGQQTLELLNIDGREHKQICSHMIHDVAGGGDGILSLNLDDREVLPPWKGLLIYCSIMRDIFDKNMSKNGAGY